LGLADEYLKQSGWPLFVSGRAHDLLSGVLHAWNDLPGAVYHARQGVALCKGWGQPDFLASAYCRLARALHAAGQVADAMETIRDARKVANRVSPSYGDHIAAWEAKLWLAQGNVAQAIRWARESDLHIDDEFRFDHLFKYECLARVLIAQGQDDPACLERALLLLTRLLAAAERSGAAYFMVRFLVLEAGVLVHNQIAQARVVLVRALDMAESQGYIRIFVDEFEQIGNLMLSILTRRQGPQQTAGQSAAPDYVNRLLSALRDESGAVLPQTTLSQSCTLVEPLSERELEVLHLVATGLSNRQIAQSLVIAVNTVKNHLKNIYGKLAVHSRTQAVERARNLDLL
jgi:LuxR family maltose regulon positive regulatory protein